MGSNRKFKNGMWKDESKQQENVSQNTFLRLQDLFKSEFKGMTIQFNQVTGECGYTFQLTSREYFMLLNRKGTIIQENLK